jgi:hypothetical protein
VVERRSASSPRHSEQHWNVFKNQGPEILKRFALKPSNAPRVLLDMRETTDPAATPPAANPAISLPMALTIMGVILCAGGGLIWKYLYRPAPPANAIRTVVPLPGNPRVAGGPVAGGGELSLDALKAAAGEADLPDGLHPRGADAMLVKAGDAYIRVQQHEGENRYTFGFFTLAEQEWEHGYLTLGVRHMLAQEDFAREIGLTDDQRARLEKLPAAPTARWPQGDRDHLIALYKDEKSRPQVVAALGAYAAERRAADQKVMADRIRQIHSILNEKQLARVNPIPRWPLGPASSPSTPDRVPRGP